MEVYGKIDAQLEMVQVYFPSVLSGLGIASPSQTEDLIEGVSLDICEFLMKYFCK